MRTPSTSHQIRRLFPQNEPRVYLPTELARLFREQRSSLRVPEETTATDFRVYLVKNRILRACTFRSEEYQHEITRYACGKPSVLQLAASLRPRGYFSHATAVALHGLAKLTASTVYFNVEQSAKPASDGSLSQEAIDRVFAGKQRQSNLIYRYKNTSVVIIAGKNTQRLGVEEVAISGMNTLPTTNVERTLIDIVVRPNYSGGPSQLLTTYRAAKDRVSVDRLLETLKALNYVYPYHQAMGFLMQRAGYSEAAYTKLHTLGLSYDFHLAHAINDKEYSKEWRLYFPRGLRE